MPGVTPDTPKEPVRGARRAVASIFFVNGAVLASWVPHIPAVKARHALSDGELGILLLFMAVGAVSALPVAGWLVARLGSRRMTSLAALALSVALPAPVVAPHVVIVALALVVFGACNGLLDVSMNAQAVAVEQRYGRAIMSSFHALFSLGGLVGAGVAAGVMATGVGDAAHVAGTALVSLLAVGAAIPWLLRSPPAERVGVGFARPDGVLLGLGTLAFCGLVAEGAMGDWSAVYLHDTLASSAALAATGFAAFSVTMAAGRFGGDRLVARFGPAAVLRGSGAVGALGLAVALTLGTARAGIAGCALVGLGLANVIPIVFSAAGRIPGVPPATGLAAVATTGYVGFLAGPPAIGLAAQLSGLRVALGIVSALCALIALVPVVRTSPGVPPAERLDRVEPAVT